MKKRDVKEAFNFSLIPIDDGNAAIIFLDYIDNHIDITSSFSPSEFAHIYALSTNGELSKEITLLLIRLAKHLQSEMTFSANEVQALLAMKR